MEESRCKCTWKLGFDTDQNDTSLSVTLCNLHGTNWIDVTNGQTLCLPSLYRVPNLLLGAFQHVRRLPPRVCGIRCLRQMTFIAENL
jgi:hypothetical protein